MRFCFACLFDVCSCLSACCVCVCFLRVVVACFSACFYFAWFVCVFGLRVSLVSFLLRCVLRAFFVACCVLRDLCLRVYVFACLFCELFCVLILRVFLRVLVSCCFCVCSACLSACF